MLLRINLWKKDKKKIKNCVKTIDTVSNLIYELNVPSKMHILLHLPVSKLLEEGKNVLEAFFKLTGLLQGAILLQYIINNIIKKESLKFDKSNVKQYGIKVHDARYLISEEEFAKGGKSLKEDKCRAHW